MCESDLKPANCLIDAVGCVKIADMNISKVSKGVDMKVGRSSQPDSKPAGRSVVSWWFGAIAR